MPIPLLLSLVCASSPGIRIAVLPAGIDPTARELPALVFDESVLAAVAKVTSADVVGRDDIESLLGFEQQRDMVGCDDTSCFIEIGGALGVDKLMSVKVAKVGDDWVITTKLIDVKKTKVDARGTEFLTGGAVDLMRALPQVIDNLMKGGGLIQTSAEPTTTAALSSTTSTAPSPVNSGESPAPSAVVLPAMDDVRVAVLLRQAPAETQAGVSSLSERLWPHPWAHGAPSPAVEEDGRTLELLLRVEARRALGPVDAAVGRRRYDEIAPKCFFDHTATTLCHEAATLVLAEYTDDTAYRAAELYQKACERNDAGACEQTKRLTASFAARDNRRKDGGRMLSNLCLAGDRSACDALKTFQGSGWSGPLAMACANNSKWACSVVVARDDHWQLGKSQRDIGFWIALLGWVVTAPLGGVAGFYIGAVVLAGQNLSRPDLAPPIVGAAVGTTVGALLAVGTGLVVWGVGRSKVSAAEDLAEEYNRQGGLASSTVPELQLSPSWIAVRQGDTTFQGPAFVLAF